jgi:flagellin
MSMVVQHNLTAMNSNRQLGITTSAQAKSAEKLSSGYRINRAGDDAAGLKISEKMRSQIRGLDKASSNAEDGVSLIQTAEGALNEAHSILQRMNELAVQGANDTNESIDRDAINEELDALTEELDRISSTTQFNKQNLLDGSFSSKNLQVGANANQKIAISITNMDATSLGLRSIEIPKSDAELQSGLSFIAFSYNGTTYDYDNTSGFDYNVSMAASTVIDAISQAYLATNSDATYIKQLDSTTGSVYWLDSEGTRCSKASLACYNDLSIAKHNASSAIYNNPMTYLRTENVDATSATLVASAAAAKQVIGVPKVDDYKTANATITAVQEAINRVSSQRSALGALQNRLEHTIANLDNISENTSSAESRIRDTDMAEEMVEYSKNNILAQAGQSMLAQSNQSTQGVLSLLQ